MNLLGIFILCFIHLGAYAVQFIYNELHCPLCLMQRMDIIGVTFGLALNVRYIVNSAHYVFPL
ncbi:disulfide bond formation protein B [Bacteroidetes bacterium endosymbiont of Geopemphigus sp.]|uniref:disulfide bond formation protein B n=1 Tax=Bacteroidetes bacterium endosymbiont of Geopemphigus sp. TaxID=2047937 RepID=UPI003D2F52D0